MITTYKKNDRVKVIGRLHGNTGGWKRPWTKDMYHTISLNKNGGESPVLVVVQDDGEAEGVLCHDGNHWPHRVLELVG